MCTSIPSLGGPLRTAGLLLVVLSGLHGLDAQAKPRIAVVDMANNSAFSYWGDYLGAAAADEMATELVRSGAFTVIEREKLDQILAEQRLGMSGAVDASTIARIGELLGVQLVITGSITQFSIETKSGGIGPLSASYTEAESVLDVRAVSTTTGEIMAAVEGSAKKRLVGARYEDKGFERTFDAGLAQEALRPAIEKAVAALVEQSGSFAELAAVADATVVGEREGSIYLDQGENHGVQVGQHFDIHRVIDEIRDSQGNVLDQVTEKVGVIEVTRVLSQSAICRIVEGEAKEGDSAKRR